LLNKDIGSILQYIKSRNKLTSIFTNGTVLNRSKQSELIISHFDQLTVSFVSLDGSEHEKFVGTSFTTFDQNIKWLSNQPVELNVIEIVTNRNYHQLFDIYTYFIDNNFRHVTFNFMRDYGMEHIKQHAIISPTERERETWKRQLENMQSCYYRTNVRYTISNNLKERFEDPLPQQSVRLANTRNCLQPWNRWFINITGDLRPCCGTKNTIGNIFNDKDIIGNKKHELLKHSLLTGDFTEECTNCPIATKCTVEELKLSLREYQLTWEES
jgi:radical SAM protein with 4Fe4S-binding SPASM domain